MTKCNSCGKTFNYDIQSVACPHEVIEELCNKENIKIISVPTFERKRDEN